MWSRDRRLRRKVCDGVISSVTCPPPLYAVENQNGLVPFSVISDESMSSDGGGRQELPSRKTVKKRPRRDRETTAKREGGDSTTAFCAVNRRSTEFL